jgi:hypothetical protein
MDLSPYLDGLRRDLAASVAAGGPDIARAGELLTGAIEPAARLTLLEVLSEAAAEITAALDDVEVDVRMRGRDADLVITEAAHPAPTAPPPAEPAPAEPEGDTARITLRLPEQLKAQVERAAAAEGISVNAWLVRATAASLHTPPFPPQPPPPPFPGRRGRRITGFAQG